MLSGGRRVSRVGLACVAVLAAAPAEPGPLGWGAPPWRAPAPCPSTAPSNAPSDVRLVWVDVAGVARAAFPEARREVLSLLGRMDVRATMREGDVHGTSDGSELIVIVLPGPPPGGRLHDHVMGATQRTPEGVRAMWVYASGVAATLGLEPAPAAFWPPRQRRQFGVALGRVVVHELVHALAPQRPHVGGGLMAERMGRTLLLRSGLPIDATTARAVRESLAGGAVRRGPVAAMP
jgi:hypothetical protein